MMKAEATKTVQAGGKLLSIVDRIQQAPELTLEADLREVKATATLPVRVAFRGLDRVDLELEPAQTFSLDVTSVAETGIVRLLGKADGKATLIAHGVKDGRDVAQRLLHVACEGPVVRIVAFGYLPGGSDHA